MQRYSVPLIQELLFESEQLRRETDDLGPQDEIEYWKIRSARLTLLCEQLSSLQTKMTTVTLRVAHSKLMKIWVDCEIKVMKYNVEAKDNAKFLGSIEKSSHSIYLLDPYKMNPSLMRLIHIIKMIYQVSGFYNTSERVASLLVKIKNQVIRSCKKFITESGSLTIWNQERPEIERKLTQCIKLKNQYREAYEKISNRIIGRETRKFCFSEKYIFGRFDSFCKRLQNLLEMFKTINQFTNLFKSRMEALLPEDALADDQKKFEAAVNLLTQKDYDYLDFRNMAFDRDYGDFLNRMDDLTGRLQVKLETTYDGIWDTPHAFQYINRFERLSEILPIGGMTDKYTRMIATFKKEMERTLATFKRQTANPPIVRNYPVASGKIYWVRSLVYNLRSVINTFEKQKKMKKLPEYRKLVKQYNDTGVFLMQYELKIQEGWNNRNPKFKEVEKKISLPILRESNTGEILMNFDTSFYSLLKESEKLMKLDIPMPMINQFLVKRMGWYYDYKSVVEMMLAHHEAAENSVVPEWRKLFNPFLNKIRATLDPGKSQIMWYTADWEDFTSACIEEIKLFQNLLDRANDIYNNRINTTLDSMDYVDLYALPKKEAWTFEHFLDIVKEKCKEGAKALEQKSRMVEESVEDIIGLAFDALFDQNPDVDNEEEEEDGKGERNPLQKRGSQSSEFLTVSDREQQNAMNKVVIDIRRNYSKKILEKLEIITRNALRYLTKYFATSVVEETPKPRFDCEEIEGVNYSFILKTMLCIPTIEVEPTINQIQATLVSAGNLIMSVSKGVGQWQRLLPKQKVDSSAQGSEASKVQQKLYNPVKSKKPLIEAKANNYHSAVAENKEVNKSFAQFSSCMAGLRMELTKFNERWLKYSELWDVDKEVFIHDFMKKKPTTCDFESELKRYNLVEAELKTESDEFRYGQMLISNVIFKKTLTNEIKQWVNGIGASMQAKYRGELDVVIAQVNELDKKLDRPIGDLDDIRIIMETQKKIRDIEIDLDIKIDTIETAFSIMAKYELQMSKDDVDKVETLGECWLKCQAKAMHTYVLLLDVQEHFKAELKKNVQAFQLEADAFVVDYNEKGPMEPGLSPKEASDRLEHFQNTFDTLWRKHNSYSVGEDLFGLPHSDQSEIEGIKRELNLLQRLYKLYNDVIDSVNGYQSLTWKNINIEEISNELMEYQNRCR